MLTKEIREWLEKVERGQYSYENAMSEFFKFSVYLTKEEIKTLKKKLESSYKS